MKIPAFLSFISRKPEIKIQVVDSSAHRLTVAECRKDERVTSMCRTALDTPSVKFMLRALENSNPGQLALPIQGASPNDRVALQAVAQGYLMCLNDLRALGEAQPKGKKALEATYEPAEKK